MKRIFILLVFFFNSNYSQAQNLLDIKNQNVFFILFEKGNLTKKDTIYTYNKKIREPRYSYYYYRNKNKNFISRYPYFFNYSKYRNNRDANNQINETMVYCLHKSFLRKNKNIIITKEFMDKVGVNKIVDLIYGSNKHIFLIEEGEIKKNKILLREVKFHYLPDGFEPIIKNIKDN